MFSNAVLDIFNCQNVTISNITVQNNTGNGLLLESFRGNTGGVAIGYNILPDDFRNPTLHISHSTFRDNQANGFRSPNRAVAANVYLGRAGGLGLFLNESLHNISIHIFDCVFESNFARLFGGGLFILTQSHIHNQLVKFHVEESRFIGNQANFGGAGIQLSYLNSGSNERPHTAVFRRCEFINNRGPSGSGIYIFVGKWT